MQVFDLVIAGLGPAIQRRRHNPSRLDARLKAGHDNKGPATQGPRRRAEDMGIVEAIALSMGAAWASGINLYAALLTLGLLGATDSITLPPALEILTHPGVIMAAGFMYFVEFFADKTPGVDSGWDAIHTFVRIPAGAVLAAGAIGEVAPSAEIIALILGGSLAATAHATKAGGRLLINASPEPFSNWGASIAEDVAVIGGLWLALQSPWLFLALLLVFLVAFVWLFPKLWRGIRALFRRIARLFDGLEGGGTSGPAEPPREGSKLALTLKEDGTGSSTPRA